MYSLQLLVYGLHAPEAAGSQRDGFIALRRGILRIDRVFLHLAFWEIAAFLAAAVLTGCDADKEQAEEGRKSNCFHDDRRVAGDCRLCNRKRMAGRGELALRVERIMR